MTNYLRALYYLIGLTQRAYWPRDRLKQHQDRRLRQIVSYAYDNVSFYHSKFRQHGIRPSEIKGAADLEKLPILRKDDMRKNPDSFLSVKSDRSTLKTLRTSGSTGKPLHFCISNKEDDYRKAKHLRANMSIGQKPRDRWVTVTSGLHAGTTTKLQRMLGIFVPTFVSVFEKIDTQISILGELKPDVLDGYSSSLLLLAKEMETKENQRIRPGFLIGGAELISDSSRRLIERVFDAPLYDQYACEEMERIAWQCQEKNEYHIDSDSMIVEFVDKSGEGVSTGERGEILCTSLFNYATPFIRYAVGDIGVPSDSSCSCGRTLPLMKLFEGRKDSFLVLSSGRILSPMAFDGAMCMFKFHDCIDEYRLIQRRIGRFEFDIKLRSEDIEEAVLEKELTEYLYKTWKMDASEASFEIKFVDSIPLEETGKLRKVVSELGNLP